MVEAFDRHEVRFDPRLAGCSKFVRFSDYEALRAELERVKQEREQLLDKLHCMCGSPIDHSAYEGHTAVSVYDYSLDQERERAEAAEAERDRLADWKRRAVEVLEPFAHEARTISDRSGVPEYDISPEMWISVRLANCRAARDLVREDENG